MAESPNVWRRFWSHFGWLDSIDVLLYGGLGLALLGFTIYSIANALLNAGHTLAFALLVVFVALSVGFLLRDLWRGQLTTLSKCFAGAWGLCVILVIVIELIESFS